MWKEDLVNSTESASPVWHCTKAVIRKDSLKAWLLSTKDLKLRGMMRHIDIVIDQ